MAQTHSQVPSDLMSKCLNYVVTVWSDDLPYLDLGPSVVERMLVLPLGSDTSRTAG